MKQGTNQKRFYKLFSKHMCWQVVWVRGQDLILPLTTITYC
jgi:hypothetical protein